MVDSIEYCVNKTGDYMEDALIRIIDANKYKSKYRKVKEIRHSKQAMRGRTIAETRTRFFV